MPPRVSASKMPDDDQDKQTGLAGAIAHENKSFRASGEPRPERDDPADADADGSAAAVVVEDADVAAPPPDLEGDAVPPEASQAEEPQVEELGTEELPAEEPETEEPQVEEPETDADVDPYAGMTDEERELAELEAATSPDADV